MTLKDLADRLDGLEGKLDAVLSRLPAPRPGREPAGIIPESHRPEYEVYCRQLGFDRMKRIGAKALQQMFLDAGHDPNSNEFSREIIAMREEWRTWPTCFFSTPVPWRNATSSNPARTP